VIDTGNAAPIAIKKIYNGPKEIPIMRKANTALQKVGHIRQLMMGVGSFRPSLPPNRIKVCSAHQ
jgi:hypothetical protein